ncbi:COR domain-containing protein [Aquimarina sp. Aq107]|uniref:leucine-rich repeat domain-containing protein n=1 Tax=Aquimarina sp. Aq107 TaxID=1191912 RepID=UPI000D54F393|nr:COR domain-containing protein [Aquimarina sp. Aq107]
MLDLAQRIIKQAKNQYSTSLDLRNCNLTKIPDEILEVKDLSILNLRGNSISDLSFLEKIDSLKELDIRGNVVDNISSLRNLSNLEVLDIGYNSVSDFSPLANLINLKKIWLENNNISNIFFLEKLANLEHINLQNNCINDLSYLTNLSGLKSIDIQNNNISDFSFLKKINSLEILNLGYNQISDISFLKNLSSITFLNLRNNKITNGFFLENLTKLENLDLVGNNIKDLSFLTNLKSLEKLDIQNNQISNIPNLEQLTKIRFLDISANRIKNLSFLKESISLEVLLLSNNKISDLSVLDSLINLKFLDIKRNKVSDISPLKKLYSLELLDLKFNNISEINSLKGLSNLRYLDLVGNSVTSIQPLISIIKKGVPVKWKQHYLQDSIYLMDNPLSSPPPEIVQKGNKAIINFFDEINSQGGEFIYEAKMLIVGKGGVGKTSLVSKLLDRDSPLPKEEGTTKGIDIRSYGFVNNKGINFTVNIWDFGGQEIYHATHQFFLTKRSIYILVDDTKDDDRTVNDASFKYWLQTIELFGGNSPLLIFQNEKGGRSKDIDFKSMKSQFDFIKERYSSDLLNPGKSLDDLEEGLKYQMQTLPHIGSVLPKNWILVRNELLNLAKGKPYISCDLFLNLCKKYSIVDREKASELSQYLHDLGSILHFNEDPLLRKTIILQNEWATAAVYRVLDDEEVKKNNGRFTLNKASKIWKESIYREMHPELLALMLNFELCYELVDKKGYYLIPQLLPESKPDSILWSSANNLQLRYRYRFMPKGLISRFIVRSHIYLKNEDNSWKNGVILQKDDAIGLIEEKFAQNLIIVRVSGVNKKELISIISSEIDKLNSSYDGINVEKLVPCNCKACVDSDEPHFYNYNNIIDHIKYGKYLIGCLKPPFETVHVNGLLDNYEYDNTNSLSDQSKETKNFNFGSGSINTIYYNDKKGLNNIEGAEQIRESLIKNERKSTKWFELWWMSRLALGLLGGVFGAILLSFFFELEPFISFIICFILITSVLLLKGNPERRFFRAARFSLGLAISLLVLKLSYSFQLEKTLKDGQVKVAFEWASQYDWIISIVLILLSAFLYLLDWRKDRNDKN